MTIEFDSVSGTNTYANGSNDKTVSHILGGSSNRIVIGFVVRDQSRTISTITYNGVAMTHGVSKTEGTRIVSIYYLLESSLPSAGTYNFRVALSGNAYGVMGCFSLSNVKQQTPEATANASSGVDVANWSNNITTITNNAWAIDCCAVWGQRTGTAGTNQVERFDTGDTQIALFSSTKPVPTAGASAMAWTPSSNASYAQAILALEEAASVINNGFWWAF